MAVQTAVSVIIGAELGGTFKGAFGDAQRQLGTLGNAIKQLDAASNGIGAFKTLGRDTIAAGREWKNAEANLKKLAAEMRAADKPSKTLQANFRAAQKEASLAKTAYQQNRAALSEMSANLKKAGVDTRNLTAEQTRLGQAIEILKNRQTALAAVEAKKQANLAARKNYRAQIMDAVALGTSLYAAMKPAVEFETAMAKVGNSANIAADGEGFKNLTAQARELGKTTQYTAVEAAEAMRLLAEGGMKDANQIMAAAPSVLHLAAAGNMELATAAGLASGIMSGFNIQGAETKRVADVLAQTARNTGQSMESLGDTIKQIAPTATAVGGTLEETAALVGLLGDAGVQSSKTISTLRSAYLRLAAPAKQGAAELKKLGEALGISVEQMPEVFAEAELTQAQLKKMGVSVFDSTGKMRSMTDILRQLGGALKGATDEKKMSVLKQIFGANATSGMMALLKQTETGRLDEITDKIGKAGGAAEEMSARMKNTAQGALKEFKSSVEGIGIAVGSALLPAFASMARGAAWVANHIAAFAEQFPVLTKYVGLAIAGLTSMKVAGIALGYGFTFIKGGVLAAVGIFTQARTAISLLRLGFGGLIPIIRAVGAAFMTNPIGLIIGALAIGAAALIYYWKPVKEFFADLFAPLISVFGSVWDWITGIWEKAKDIFKGISEWVQDSWVGKAWNWAFGSGGETKTKRPDIGSSVSGDIFSPTNQSAVELPRSNITNASQSSVSVSAPITINASPGMNVEEVARQVSKELDAREQAAGRRARGINYD